MVYLTSLTFWLALALLNRSLACSYFEVNTSLPEGKIMGHTMEFDRYYNVFDSYFKVIPRGYPHRLYNDTNDTACGSQTSSQGSLGYVGIEFADLFGDGMNEEGLIIASQSLYRSQYQKCNPCSKHYKTINIMQLPAYILSHFKNVPDLKWAIRHHKICVVNTDKEKTSNLHWAIADKKGNSIVLEYIDGEPQIHENYVGVMTNDPPYLWQVDNLNTFAWLTADANVTSQDLRLDTGNQLPGTDAVPKNWGHGFNMGGLPADASPPSRFVRMFYTRQVSQLNSKPQDMPEFMALVQGILNTIYIPKGFTGVDPSQQVQSDHTAWATMRVPSTGFYAFRTYANMQWHVINTKLLGWNQAATLNVSGSSILDSFKDITGDLPQNQKTARTNFLAPVQRHEGDDSVFLQHEEM
ncbi:unnamed protein product [Effrenium voratum]|uniref:Choloylglycine hydrolase/NAAA C-terminal domain-containing protein n=1 Tax=Effrenium voratum TaxID=2562239 RepID=A0AA36JBD1_9DINO|nr:unnamed protein product [Effrenium voratum]CAJ1433059.1 unnamed protein product [Effrenium voratum]